MHIHEYQAKTLLQKAEVPVPPFGVASNEEELLRVIEALDLRDGGVVKIQVHAGGRGKAGGVIVANSEEELLAAGKKLIGMRIVNNQTGPKGIVAEKVLLTPKVAIKHEYYLAVTYDRTQATPLIIASKEGGVEIEEVAAKSPEKIWKEPIGSRGEIRTFQRLAIAKFLGWEGPQRWLGVDLLGKVARLFAERDASLLEINPLVESEEGELLALDAKITLDDNAFFRHPEMAQWYDPSQGTEGEKMAREFDLSYVALDGDIGCMVNGAGLAMATMDIIHDFGGKPANFLDVGGGAGVEKVAHGFRIILSDPNVRAIFVNIFGGIMDCAVLAQGIVEASKKDQVTIPLIVRMEGTNVDKGKQILAESGLAIITAADMADGAQKAVEAARR